MLKRHLKISIYMNRLKKGIRYYRELFDGTRIRVKPNSRTRMKGKALITIDKGMKRWLI